MIKLPLKMRIKRVIHKRMTYLFYGLSHKQSVLLKIGFMERLRRKFAPTYEEMREDIISQSTGACDAIRGLMNLESVYRKVMPPEALSLGEIKGD